MTTLHDEVEGLTHGLIDDLRTCCGIFWNMTRTKQHTFRSLGVYPVVTCIACLVHANATYLTPSWRIGF